MLCCLCIQYMSAAPILIYDTLALQNTPHGHRAGYRHSVCSLIMVLHAWSLPKWKAVSPDILSSKAAFACSVAKCREVNWICGSKSTYSSQACLEMHQCFVGSAQSPALLLMPICVVVRHAHGIFGISVMLARRYCESHASLVRGTIR